MIEDLKELLKGSATSIKNKNYLSTASYVQPFIDRLDNYTKKFVCHVKMADQLSINSGSTTPVYNKVLIHGIFPSNYDIKITDINGTEFVYHRVVCMGYNLDSKKPTCKFYTGVVDKDFNFYAFGSDCISIQELEPDTPIDYSAVQTIIDNGLKDNCQAMLEQIKDLAIEVDDILPKLGEWVDFTIKKEYINSAGKVKLSNNLPIEVYKELLLNKDSDYYSNSNSIFTTNILACFLNQVATDDKDLINRYEKTQLINQLLKL